LGWHGEGDWRRIELQQGENKCHEMGVGDGADSDDAVGVVVARLDGCLK